MNLTGKEVSLSYKQNSLKEKSGYAPSYSYILENYIFKTKNELSSMQIWKFRDNLSAVETSSITNKEQIDNH